MDTANMDKRLQTALAEIEKRRRETYEVKEAMPDSKPRHVLHGQATGLELADEIIRRHFGEEALTE